MLSVSLNIDDGSPINLYHFHDLSQKHELQVPAEFIKKFGRLCRKYGAKGKFSVVPMPACRGRLDEKVQGISKEDLKRFIRTVQQEIKPDFSITPEIMTHFLAWDIKRNQQMQICEDRFFSTLSAEEIAEYVGNAISILHRIDLTPDGVTSPWMTGLDNEQNYAAGIGMAFRKILQRDHCFYFLHFCDHVTEPVLMCDSPETGKVVSIPANLDDIFWNTQLPNTVKQAQKTVKEGIDILLSTDGRTGMIRDLAEQGKHISILTHWQSLFSDGRGLGLEGLEALLERIRKVFGNQVEWKTFSRVEEMIPSGQSQK